MIGPGLSWAEVLKDWDKIALISVENIQASNAVYHRLDLKSNASKILALSLQDQFCF